MFAEERQEKLLGILREKRKVAVSEMCDVFNVSGATIRADLRQLEEEGLLTRTHGGAVLRTRASFEQASDAREIVNLSAKERIGQRAAALVEDGDIIELMVGQAGDNLFVPLARCDIDAYGDSLQIAGLRILHQMYASLGPHAVYAGNVAGKLHVCLGLTLEEQPLQAFTRKNRAQLQFLLMTAKTGAAQQAPIYPQ